MSKNSRQRFTHEECDVSFPRSREHRCEVYSVSQIIKLPISLWCVCARCVFGRLSVCCLYCLARSDQSNFPVAQTLQHSLRQVSEFRRVYRLKPCHIKHAANLLRNEWNLSVAFHSDMQLTYTPHTGNRSVDRAH